jgi:linoleoyl-CoA desaturase
MEHIKQRVPSDFDKDIRAYMVATMKRLNISQYGDWRLYLKTIVFFVAVPYFYLGVIHSETFLEAGLNSVGFGTAVAGAGMCVMHDCSHDAFCKYKWVNAVVGFIVMNGLGADFVNWYYKHVKAHHSEPNVKHVDDDVEMGPLFCIDQAEMPKPIHKYQHIYAWPLYALLNILWIILLDFRKWKSKKVGTTKIKRTVLGHVIFIFTKFVWVPYVFIYVPFHFSGITGLLCLWFIGFGISGLVLASIFQGAHVSMDLHIEHKDMYKSISPQRHQLRETTDFDSHTPLGLAFSWYVGGLDYQVLHHLFPWISHIHYHQLAPYARRFVKYYSMKYKEPNLVYNRLPSFPATLASHYWLLKRRGQPKVAM